MISLNKVVLRFWTTRVICAHTNIPREDTISPHPSHLTSFYISKNNKTVVTMRSRRCRCITITSRARLACFITDAACCKETKKQCMVVEDTIHHSRNGWGWGKEERKEEEEEGTRGMSVQQICSWEQSRLHHRQTSGPSESTESH